MHSNGSTKNFNPINIHCPTPNGASYGGARRRSHSATRHFADSTVNFVGRIGQSLRIASSSSRRRDKVEIINSNLKMCKF
jgi:hypothetical protein